MKNVSGFFITLALCLFMSHAALAQSTTAKTINNSTSSPVKPATPAPVAKQVQGGLGTYDSCVNNCKTTFDGNHDLIIECIRGCAITPNPVIKAAIKTTNNTSVKQSN